MRNPLTTGLLSFVFSLSALTIPSAQAAFNLQTSPTDINHDQLSRVLGAVSLESAYCDRSIMPLRFEFITNRIGLLIALQGVIGNNENDRISENLSLFQGLSDIANNLLFSANAYPETSRIAHEVACGNDFAKGQLISALHNDRHFRELAVTAWGDFSYIDRSQFMTAEQKQMAVTQMRNIFISYEQSLQGSLASLFTEMVSGHPNSIQEDFRAFNILLSRYTNSLNQELEKILKGSIEPTSLSVMP